MGFRLMFILDTTKISSLKKASPLGKAFHRFTALT